LGKEKKKRFLKKRGNFLSSEKEREHKMGEKEKLPGEEKKKGLLPR